MGVGKNVLLLLKASAPSQYSIKSSVEFVMGTIKFEPHCYIYALFKPLNNAELARLGWSSSIWMLYTQLSVIRLN